VNKRLQAVTDGRGQLIAIAASSGQITAAYAGSGHDQSSWQACPERSEGAGTHHPGPDLRSAEVADE